MRLGDGVGGFSGTTGISVGSAPFSVTVADVNGDGHLDILTANSGNDTVSVRLGDGAGGFSGTTDLAVGSEPRSATVADVNGDGRLDILVANNDGRTVSVLLNTTTTALSFDPASVSSATTGADTDLAIDATAPSLTGTQTVLADGTEDVAYTVTEAQLLEGWADAGTAMLTVSGLTSSSGTVTANSDGSFTITPVANATGPVTLTYGVSDGTNAPAPATRSFSLTAVNDAPLLTGTQATLAAGTEDTAFTVTEAQLLEGFADPEGTTLVLSDLSVDHGTIVSDGAGSYTVTPDANYSGQITISYDVGDGTDSIPATLSTVIAAVNDAPSFIGAGTGVVLTPVGADESFDMARGVTVQADGKIVVAGIGTGSDGPPDFALVRYNADGSLDTTFGTAGTGKILTPVGSVSNDQGNSVTLQADGKIIVAGSGAGSGTGTDFALVRYNTDGTLDTGFGTGGKILTPVGTGTSNDIGQSVTVQADGKIVVAGQGSGSGGTDFAVVRYNANGSLDTTFGTGGKILTPVGADTSTDFAYSVTVQADGKIVVAGQGSVTGTGTRRRGGAVQHRR